MKNDSPKNAAEIKNLTELHKQLEWIQFEIKEWNTFDRKTFDLINQLLKSFTTFEKSKVYDALRDDQKTVVTYGINTLLRALHDIKNDSKNFLDEKSEFQNSINHFIKQIAVYQMHNHIIHTIHLICDQVEQKSELKPDELAALKKNISTLVNLSMTLDFSSAPRKTEISTFIDRMDQISSEQLRSTHDYKKIHTSLLKLTGAFREFIRNDTQINRAA